MMIHANQKRKNAHLTTLLPYALRVANNLYNNAPLLKQEEHLTPIQLATGTSVEINKKHVNTFRCPIYVLNRSLQLGYQHTKWAERSKMRMYLGQLPVHNKNVALVMDLDTGLVSPQFHVMFDNDFRSVNGYKEIPLWKVKTGLASERELEISQRKKDKIPIIVPGLVMKPEGDRPITIRKRVEKGTLDNRISQPGKKIRIDDRKHDHPSGVYQSPRINPHLFEAHKLLSLQTIIADNVKDVGIKGEIFGMKTILEEIGYDDDHFQHPMAYKASTNPDTMYMHQALKELDKRRFIDAMVKEVQDQMDNNNFIIVHKNQVPKDQIILLAVCQMKRKRDVRTQKVKKYKVRLNIDGPKMVKGIHYEETYAPVASWVSIRIMLALVAAFGWYT